MKNPGRLLGKCVLVGAKVAQRVLTKPVKLGLGVAVGDGKAKLGKIARVVGKSLPDLLNDLPGDLIRRHIRPIWNGHLVAPAGTVFRVVIPFAATGLSPIQQHPITLAHVAVEIFHAQLFTTGSPTAEILTGGQESGVVVQSDRHPQGPWPIRHDLGEPVFTRCTHVDPRHSGVSQGLATSRLQAGQPIPQRPINYVEPTLTKGAGEVAHGGEQQHQFVPVVTDISSLLGDLRQ